MQLGWIQKAGEHENTGTRDWKAGEKVGKILQWKSGSFIENAGEREIWHKSGSLSLKAGDLDLMSSWVAYKIKKLYIIVTSQWQIFLDNDI